MSSQNSEAPKEVFPLRESKVMGELGLSRDDVRALRQSHLDEGVHYRREKNRMVYSEAGLRALQLAVHVPPESIPEKAAKNAQRSNAGEAEALKSAPSDVETLVVYRVKGILNSKVLLAHKKGADPARPENRLTVRVKSNVNFIAGMELQARRVAKETWELVGNCPRWRGKY